MNRARRLGQEYPQTLLGQMVSSGTLDIAGIQQAVNQGDNHAIHIIEEAGHHLGLALVNLTHVINPQKIILGSPVLDLNGRLLDHILSTVDEHILPHLAGKTEITVSQLDKDAILMGATAVLLERSLNLWQGWRPR